MSVDRPKSAGPPWRCWQVLRELQSYLDGMTDEATDGKVTAHLEECRRCGLEADTYRAIKQAIAHHERPPHSAVDRLRAFGENLVSSPPRADQ